MLAPRSMAALSQEQRLYVHFWERNGPYRDVLANDIRLRQVEGLRSGEKPGE
jgi:hypothetical protein